MFDIMDVMGFVVIANIVDIVTAMDMSVICYPQVQICKYVATYFPSANKRPFLGNQVIISVLKSSI